MDPHNPKRFGETWDAHKLAVMLVEITALRDLVVVSGGWAWHLMSPPHEELKHRHDHKDVDLFVEPARFPELINRLTKKGYQRARTRFDEKMFHRYERRVGEVHVILDVFLRLVPFVEVNGFRVVKPEELLKMYGVIHSSDKCFSVLAAKQLLDRGESVSGNSLLATYMTEECQQTLKRR